MPGGRNNATPVVGIHCNLTNPFFRSLNNFWRPTRKSAKINTNNSWVGAGNGFYIRAIRVAVPTMAILRGVLVAKQRMFFRQFMQVFVECFGLAGSFPVNGFVSLGQANL